MDTRFSYCALATCGLLRRLPALDVPAAAAFVRRCANFDGGFGATPGGESHAGQIFTALGAPRSAPARQRCFAAAMPSQSRPPPSRADSPRLAPGALAIAGALECVDAERLGAWLAARQLACGGLCGRPEKAPDVCYSWWVLSSLAILRRRHWLCAPALRDFILRCQDGAKGGISDRPDDEADVFHTFFGVAGLALLRHPGVAAMDPVYALPVATLRALGLRPATDDDDDGEGDVGEGEGAEAAAGAAA